MPGLDPARFDELAAAAEKGCPVSKVLNAITLEKRCGEAGTGDASPRLLNGTFCQDRRLQVKATIVALELLLHVANEVKEIGQLKRLGPEL